MILRQTGNPELFSHLRQILKIIALVMYFSSPEHQARNSFHLCTLMCLGQANGTEKVIYNKTLSS